MTYSVADLALELEAHGLLLKGDSGAPGANGTTFANLQQVSYTAASGSTPAIVVVSPKGSDTDITFTLIVPGNGHLLLGDLGSTFTGNSASCAGIASSATFNNSGSLAIGSQCTFNTDSSSVDVVGQGNVYNNTVGCVGFASAATTLNHAVNATVIGATYAYISGNYSITTGLYTQNWHDYSTKTGIGSLGAGLGYGICQGGTVVMAAKASGVPKTLASGPTGASSVVGSITQNTNYITAPINSSASFSGVITAKQTGSTNIAIWDIKGAIVVGSTLASAALVGGTPAAISNTLNFPIPLVSVTTGGGLLIQAPAMTGGNASLANNVIYSTTLTVNEIINF